MKDEQNNKRNLVFLIVGILTLLIAIIGATYAFFIAQTGQGQTAPVDVATGTTDNLTFSVTDLDAGEGNDHIIDEDKVVEGVDLTPITINANQNNFGKTSTSLGDGVSAKALLKANNTTNKAEAIYNVYLVVDTNDLKYTKGPEYPELILTVIGPNNQEIKNITGLKYHEKDANNDNDIGGFDITGKTKAFAIAEGYKIEVAEEAGQTEQEWKIKVTLVNFPEDDQNENTKKEVSGKVAITTEEQDTYQLAHINTIDVQTTSNSIDATVQLEDGATNEIETYYFAIEEKGAVSSIALSEKTKDEISNWQTETENHHLFSGLTPNTNYMIYSYVVDSEGFESDLYETELIPTDVVLPSITGVEVTDKTYNSITISVTAEQGSLPIEGYEYSISGGSIVQPQVETATEATHTFSGLEDGTEYTIKVRAKDSKDHYSSEYTPTEEMTKVMPYHLKCTDESGACKIAKLTNNNTLIYHNLEYATEQSIQNADKVAGDDSYRYVGANPNNYVCFGGECSNDPSNPGYKYLYRIIGIFKINDNEYQMKLIKADGATKDDLGDASIKDGAYSDNYAHGYLNYKGKNNNNLASYYWNSTDSNHLTTEDNTNVNMWKESNLNKVNLNQTFYNAIDGTYQGMIENHEWQVGGYFSTSEDAKGIYEQELGTRKLTAQDERCYNQGNTTDKVACNRDGDLTYKANIGLMYVSDYLYGTLPENWNIITDNYKEDDVKNNNWLYLGIFEWTISRNSSLSSYSLIVDKTGHAFSYYYVYNSKYVVRPVLYLKSNTKIIDGLGTDIAPFKLSLS